MKIVLTESQIQMLKLNEDLLNELKETDHIIDRFNQRLDKSSLRVTLVYQEPLGDGSSRYRKREKHVGTYKLSEREKTIINDKIALIFSYDYEPQAFGVFLHFFNIVGNLENINIWDRDEEDEEDVEEYKDLIERHILQGTGNLYFTGVNKSMEGEEGSFYADALAMIIRDNYATTAYWGRYHDFEKGKEKYMGVDRYIKNVAELKNFSIGESPIPERIKKFLDRDIPDTGDNTSPELSIGGNEPSKGEESPKEDLPLEPSKEETPQVGDLSSTDAPSTDITPTDEPPVRIKRPRIKRP